MVCSLPLRRSASKYVQLEFDELTARSEFCRLEGEAIRLPIRVLKMIAGMVTDVGTNTISEATYHGMDLNCCNRACIF